MWRYRWTWLGLAALVVVLTAIAMTSHLSVRQTLGWDPSLAQPPAPAEVLPSATLPAMFTSDSRSRRAGVEVWMRRLRGVAAPTLPTAIVSTAGSSTDSSTTFDGVSYADATGSGTPLQWVGDDQDRLLSPGLRLRDFVTHDGAPFVRIDPDLVARLERLRQRAGELLIVSGYRHPAYNLTVGGHTSSLHTAGRAADVWSPRHTSLELARLALLEMGCDIGIGLNDGTIHVDVRGELASWTYDGAPLTEPAFDAWTLVQCGLPVPDGLLQAAASFWLDEEQALAAMGEDAQPSTSSLTSARPTVEGLLSQHATTVADVYRRGAASGPGGIVLDLRNGPVPDVRYVSASSAEATALGLPPLISWCAARDGAYVAYAVVQPDTTIVGVSNELGIGGHAPTRVVPMPQGERDDALPRGSADTSASTEQRPPPAHHPSARSEGPSIQPDLPFEDSSWVVIAGSYGNESEAETRAARLERHLADRVFVLPAPEVGRYRVAVGPYSSSSAAAQARERFSDTVPEDAWIAPL